MNHCPPLRTRAAAAALALLVAAVSCGDDTGSTGVDPPPPPTVDRDAPQPITDLALSFDYDADAVRFQWTAPRDDIAHDRVDRYDLRYTYSFPIDWYFSTQVTAPPAPLVAGSPQSYALPDPLRGRDLFAMIRSIDASGNLSPVGEVAHVRVPGFLLEVTCADALSRAPVAGLEALVSARFTHLTETDAEGRFRIEDLGEGVVGVRITSGASAVPYHEFEDAFTLGDDADLLFAMIPYQDAISPLFPSILGILRDALVAPGTSEIVKNWRTLPIPWYAPSFVNGLGVDYRALAEQAAARWNERVGMEVFAPVASAPASGVVLQFLPRSVMGIQNGVTEYSQDAEGYPLLDRIKIVDDFSDAAKLYTIFLHEFGHTVRLAHLPAGFIMFAGQPLPSDITDDEVATARLLLTLPAGTNLAKFNPAAPTP